jgi:hypothetical protein
MFRPNTRTTVRTISDLVELHGAGSSGSLGIQKVKLPKTLTKPFTSSVKAINPLRSANKVVARSSVVEAQCLAGDESFDRLGV